MGVQQCIFPPIAESLIVLTHSGTVVQSKYKASGPLSCSFCCTTDMLNICLYLICLLYQLNCILWHYRSKMQMSVSVFPKVHVYAIMHQLFFKSIQVKNCLLLLPYIVFAGKFCHLLCFVCFERVNCFCRASFNRMPPKNCLKTDKNQQRLTSLFLLSVNKTADLMTAAKSLGTSSLTT